MSAEAESISKLQAAQRQLDTAIQLWFAAKDAVSIHTLAASAHQIIHDLNRNAGGDELLYDTLFIKDEFRREYVALMKSPWNFFKHADRDYAETIQLRHDSILDDFIFSLKGLSQLGCNLSRYQVLFLLWLGIHYPQWLNCPEKFRADFSLDQFADASLRALSREEFYARFSTF